LQIYGVAKKARRADEETREETLVTAILAWSIERSYDLLRAILERAEAATLELVGNRVRIPDSPPEEVRVEEQLLFEGRRFALDLVAEWREFLLVVENKIAPGELYREQLDNYHSGLRNRGVDYVLIALTPDSDEYFVEVWNALKSGREHTLFLRWSDVWRVTEGLIERSARETDALVAKELMEAIALAPGLKPFSGFDAISIDALRNLVLADRKLGEFLNALESILAGSRGEGLTLHAHHREKTFYQLPSWLWDEYHDEDLMVPEGCSYREIYFGPWFRLEKGLYTVFLEATGQGSRVISEALKKKPEVSSRFTESFLQRFPAFTLEIGEGEESVFKVYADLPLTNSLITAVRPGAQPPLVQQTAEIIKAIRHDFVEPILQISRST